MSKSKLENVEEIPPPREFGSDEDNDGADERLILRVPGPRRSSTSSLAGIDNPIFQPDYYSGDGNDAGDADLQV